MIAVKFHLLYITYYSLKHKFINHLLLSVEFSVLYKIPSAGLSMELLNLYLFIINLRVMGFGCLVRKLKNPEPKTHNPKPDFNL
jgi:hypothetical protein